MTIRSGLLGEDDDWSEVFARLSDIESQSSRISSRLATVETSVVHQFGGSGEIAFASGWVNLDNNSSVPSLTPTHRNAQWVKTGEWVNLEGVAKGGSGLITTLPPEARPPVQRGFACSGNNAFAGVAVGADGQVILYAGLATASLFLDPIRFRVA